MLLKNLTDKLCNGLTGEVVNMSNEGVTVQFKDMSDSVLITPSLFTRYVCVHMITYIIINS